jgi:hypothetical protein
MTVIQNEVQRGGCKIEDAGLDEAGMDGNSGGGSPGIARS